jgi:hypothetical protein
MIVTKPAVSGFMTSDQPIPDIRAYRQLLIDVYCAFEMMPHLHGAIPSNIRDVRAEVNAALDSFFPRLLELMPELTHDG